MNLRATARKSATIFRNQRLSQVASIFVPLIAIGLLASGAAHGRELALTLYSPECPADEPDSVQISWVTPCENGDWLFDTQNGCRMWDWHPDPHDKAVWSGSCPRGEKEGRGVVQWYEHGQPIDRFEGTYRKGKREGFGRYRWNEHDFFEGHYAHGVPNGFGTASLAGETYAGNWRNGCLRAGERVIAIGVPLRSCGEVPRTPVRRGQSAAF
jgi:hypothetical protein